MEPPALIDGSPLDIEVSMGVAVYPQHGEDPTVLLSRADVAMRMAKSEVNGFCIYESGHDPYNRRRLSLLGELRHAIAQNELVLYYQPQVDIASGKIMGVEALVRWPRTTGEMISPVEFIPLAEQTGLIRPLTLWVLEQAVRQCGRWRASGLDIKVSVNLSARNLLDPSLPDMLAAMLVTCQVSADCLMLEVTESAVMLQPERALQILTRLHEMGASLSVDDFGTGYSSLAYLTKLPVCEMKIDQSFVFGMVENENDEIIVRSTIDLAHNLGLKVVAEGVEDPETLQLLATLGCDTAQGYLFARPMPPEDFSRWLIESPWGFSSEN
jgi:EAL domain-containing protein (putative c-di-GMP-specific phosphodiesterase class I)